MDFDTCALPPPRRKPLLDELGIDGYPKTTGNRGLHVYVRLEPRWDSYQVRAAAVAAARELERRRPDLITDVWWKEERGERVFVDYNQNAPHKTMFGAWCVRARPGAQVSTPLRWEELDDGLDIGDPDVLATCATELGFDRDAVVAFLDSGAGLHEVRAEIEQANDMGITAVPTFVVNGTWAIPGAQDTDTFVNVFRQLRDRIVVESAPACEDDICDV